MIQLRKSEDRGHADHGWLNSHHTFSFADYHDPAHMGFSVLRVINDDLIAAGTGFGTHGHADMEIISYVVEGSLEHKDSMGNTTLIKPGEVQRMSAGTGVRHSEYSHEKDKPTRLLQIWILPEKKGIAPSYDQKSFAQEFATGDLILVASKTGMNASVSLNQDVNMYACKATRASEKTLPTSTQRHWWLQVVKGQVSVNGTELSDGDGAAVEGVDAIKLAWQADSEFLLFDLV